MTALWDRLEQRLMVPGPVAGGIPKILHIIWNHSPFPTVYQHHIQEFKRLHPNWTVMFWDDEALGRWMWDGAREDVAEVILHAYDNAKDKRQVSDLARFALVHQFGGMYIDCDMTPVRNMDELLQGEAAVLTCEMKDRLANSVVAGEPGNLFIGYCLDGLIETYRDPAHKNIFQRTGPVVLTKFYMEWLAEHGEPGCRLLDKRYTYPYAANSKYAGGGAEEWPEAYLIHRWVSRQGMGWAEENHG